MPLYTDTILEYHYVMGCKMKISDKYFIIIVAITTFIHDGWQQYNIHLLYVYDCYHNGICFNQPYYDLCIPAAKCLMSDLISSFFSLYIFNVIKLWMCLILIQSSWCCVKICLISNHFVVSAMVYYAIYYLSFTLILHDIWITLMQQDTLWLFLFFFTGTQYGKLEELLTVWKMD